MRVWAFCTRIVGSGFFTAEKIARATRSGLSSILGIGFGGRPRGRGLTGLFVITLLRSAVCILLQKLMSLPRQSVTLDGVKQVGGVLGDIKVSRLDT